MCNFELISKKNYVRRNDIIMFDELSREAQERALQHYNIEHAAQKHWDVLPIAYIHNNFDASTQQNIDDEALCQIGFYDY